MRPSRLKRLLSVTEAPVNPLMQIFIMFYLHFQYYSGVMGLSGCFFRQQIEW